MSSNRSLRVNGRASHLTALDETRTKKSPPAVLSQYFPGWATHTRQP